MENNNDFQIRQNGNIILSGDGTSIGIIFNNLTGKNYKENPAEYKKYKKFVQSQGFDLYCDFQKYEGDQLIETGKFNQYI